VKTSEYVFASVFADEITAHLALRKSQGRQVHREKYIFLMLDQYLQSKCAVEKALSPALVEGWLLSLPEGMHVNTKIVYISHYTQFAKYLHTLGFAAFIPERPRDDRQYAPYIFSPLEMERIFVAADSRVLSNCTPDKTAGLHFPLILRLLYGCGLRLNEALRLRCGDVDLNGGVLLIHNAKGDKDRLIPMDLSLTEILRKYFTVAGKGEAPQDLFFENRKGEQRSEAWASTWFQWCLKAAGIAKPDLPRYSRNICLHCLRHTFAVDSLRKQDLADVDMYDAAPLLSTYLGHKNFHGTQRYIHLSEQNSADIVAKNSAYTMDLFPEVPL